ncbi:MAG: hypothetical protein GDA44_08495 [Prochloron sp. SP5CPC1]|nr:hypothetical protein [Candidatus Paraprochloron terpiosi SP5CPC1]
MEVIQRKEHIFHSSLPLAIYREVAAHLRQVEGVKTGLLSRDGGIFDYNQSQLQGLWLEYPEKLDTPRPLRLEAILAYYAQCYGAWERQSIQ